VQHRVKLREWRAAAQNKMSRQEEREQTQEAAREGMKMKDRGRIVRQCPSARGTEGAAGPCPHCRGPAQRGAGV